MTRPNIVFVMSDQHRWDFMGYEENGVTHTPHLDRIGREGTIFRAAHCTSPLCSPSRAALALGRYGMNSGCFTNLHKPPAGSFSFVHQLRSAGYHTCAVGKTHMEIHAYDSDLTSDAHRAYMDSLGWCETHETSGQGMLRTGIRCVHSEYLKEAGVFEEVVRFYQQWHYFMDKDAAKAPNPPYAEWTLPEEYQETTFVGRLATQWIEAWDGSRPFFLHVGFGAPHPPLEPLPRFMDLYRGAPEPSPWGVREPSEELIEKRRAYRAMISGIDHVVGEIHACLKQKGIWEETIFVFTSDHGSLAGDHGGFGQCNFFEGSLRVPLIMAGPGIQRGQVTHALVELLDLGKTLCELAGVAPHVWDQGLSLVPLLSGAADRHRDTIYAEMGCDRLIRDDRFKLMWGDPLRDSRRLGRLHLDKPVNIPPSPPRLYDLREDPYELSDIVDTAADVRQRMLEKLVERMIRNVQMQPFQSRGEYRPVRVDGCFVDRRERSHR